MNITVNGVALASTTADLDDSTPAATAGHINVSWQKDALTPTNVSAQVPVFGTSPGSNLVTTSLGGDPTANNCVKWVAGGKLDDAGSACGSGGGANTALSNLASVAVNASLVPGSAATINLGSSALPWANSFIGNAANKSFTWDVSALTGNKTAYVPDASSTLVVPDTGASNNFLTAISATGSISKAQPSFSNISGTATVGQGGTGGTTFTAHGVLLGNTTSAFNVTSSGTSGQCLVSNGSSSDPTYQTCPGGSSTGAIPIPKARSPHMPHVATGSGAGTGSWGDAMTSSGSATSVAGAATTDPYAYVQWATTTTNGACAGYNGLLIYWSSQQPYTSVTLKMSQTTAIRVFAGFSDQTLATMCASDNPAGNYAGLQYSTNRGDTKWQCITKDNTTQEVATNPVATPDANWHYLEVVGNKSVPNYTFKVDGTQACDANTTHLPSANTAMKWMIAVTCINCTPTAVNIRSTHGYVEVDFP
jgi:hypothetical protein